jgi:hypothetical protein
MFSLYQNEKSSAIFISPQERWHWNFRANPSVKLACTVCKLPHILSQCPILPSALVKEPENPTLISLSKKAQIEASRIPVRLFPPIDPANWKVEAGRPRSLSNNSPNKSRSNGTARPTTQKQRNNTRRNPNPWITPRESSNPQDRTNGKDNRVIETNNVYSLLDVDPADSVTDERMDTQDAAIASTPDPSPPTPTNTNMQTTTIIHTEQPQKQLPDPSPNDMERDGQSNSMANAPVLSEGETHYRGNNNGQPNEQLQRALNQKALYYVTDAQQFVLGNAKVDVTEKKSFQDIWIQTFRDITWEASAGAGRSEDPSTTFTYLEKQNDDFWNNVATRGMEELRLQTSAPPVGTGLVQTTMDTCYPNPN